MAGRLILAIDNSLNLLNIALAREEELIEERHIRPDKPPSQTIPGAVLQILADHDCLVEDLSLIIATLGPGSFTGIRVGLAFCKGLASGKKIPLIGVPTLDVLASPFSFLEGHYLCPLIDAKKGEVFLSSLWCISRKH
ncbi:MAG: tRNA (adenosine(37)-N6)-threonylcarbamoyltransferase complex dimerization subunit type 1 TsaB [Desulfosudis oleivorans]|nr:tRNA (adenosine(37)-N6)-threonylcarbamoyltransferase complex dimerization subunit type 1 TsaB [Desulfosudis oleivorans]